MSYSTTYSLKSIKAASKAREIEGKLSVDRQRNILILILSHLNQHGYVQTAAQLQSEASTGGILSRWDTADNIDLIKIVTEYEEFHELKYGRTPVLSRKKMDSSCSGSSNAIGSGSSRRRHHQTLEQQHCSHGQIDLCAKSDNGDEREPTSNTSAQTGKQRRKGKVSNSSHMGPNHLIQSDSTPHAPTNLRRPKTSVATCRRLLPPSSSAFIKDGTSTRSNSERLSNRGNKKQKEWDVHQSNISIHEPDHLDNDEKSNVPSRTIRSSSLVDQEPTYSTDTSKDRLLKPLPSFDGDLELRSMAVSIQRDILDSSPEVAWEDVIELDNAKWILKEAVVIPLKYPDLFHGLLVPWRGVLLYGPSGVGKTMLAKAVATESEMTFFNISASSIVSKFRGESEKLIKVLFTLARHYAPSIIFMDEIDSILSQRGGSFGSTIKSADGGMEHEGSRRLKTELLVEMDGLGKGSEHVFVLACSNTPWDLDPALLRRLEKRILVPMPNKATRKKMIQSYLSQHSCNLKPKEYDDFAIATNGYSGADIKLVCKEAAMRPVRAILKKLESLGVSQKSSGKGNSNCAIDVQLLLRRNPIRAADIQSGIACTKPSTSTEFNIRYNLWAEQFGSS